MILKESSKMMHDTYITCIFTVYIYSCIYYLNFFIWIDIDEGKNHPQIMEYK